MTGEQFKYEWDDECNCDCSIITYDSLIERLEEQLEYNNGFAKQDAQNALKFIVWQKEERDRLLQKLQQLKSEAIKEFAERLKKYFKKFSGAYWMFKGEPKHIPDDIILDIDNLVKETEEESAC